MGRLGLAILVAAILSTGITGCGASTPMASTRHQHVKATSPSSPSSALPSPASSRTPQNGAVRVSLPVNQSLSKATANALQKQVQQLNTLLQQLQNP